VLLTGEVEEFQPYVFQILAQLLEARSPPLADAYQQLFPFLLNAALWESQANTTPLVRLLVAIIRCGPDIVLATDDTLQALLGIFQKLMASRVSLRHRCSAHTSNAACRWRDVVAGVWCCMACIYGGPVVEVHEVFHSGVVRTISAHRRW